MITFDQSIKKASIMIGLVIGCLSTAEAQEIWSLEKCIQHAIENNLDVEENTVALYQADLSQKLALQERIPSVFANSSYNLNFGQRIDPTTNDYINQQFGNQGLSLSSNVSLYEGGRISKQIKRTGINRSAADLDIQQIKNDIALEVTQAYIQILFAQENYQNALHSLNLINSQLEQLDKSIASGIRPANQRLDLQAQSAQSEQLVIASHNEIDVAYLILKQLLQLDDPIDIIVDAPLVELPKDHDVIAIQSSQVYSDAVSWQPAMKASDLRKKSAQLGVELSKSNMVPSLFLGGGLGSNWSSSGLDSYTEQLKQNLGYGFGLSLQVPIYSQGRNKSEFEGAKLDVIRENIADKRIRNQLRNDIERSVTDLKAAKLQYEAALKTVQFRRLAYTDAQKQYNLGVINNYDFIAAQNNRDRAEVELLVAKYDYIYKNKIVDYYRGINIGFN